MGMACHQWQKAGRTKCKVLRKRAAWQKGEPHGLQLHSQSRRQEGGRTCKMLQAGQMAAIKMHVIMGLVKETDRCKIGHTTLRLHGSA
jgi:hypothetical protein